jgi:DNA-3-methyladenine glycosylase II
MPAIAEELAARDKRLAKVIGASPLCTLGAGSIQDSNFVSLVESVVSQQLSVKAADAIYKKVELLAGAPLTPESLDPLSDIELRSCGLSNSKVRTIRGLTYASISGQIDFENLHAIDDDHQIAQKLTSLWGIGQWTVDMFMMHQLGRLDVWPVGDLGVRKGWQKIYGLAEPLEQKAMAEEGAHLRPYRSVVAWYCWKALDLGK